MNERNLLALEMLKIICSEMGFNHVSTKEAKAASMAKVLGAFSLADAFIIVSGNPSIYTE